MKRVFALLALGLLLSLTARAENNHDHTVTLKWDAPAAASQQKIIGYNVYRSEGDNGPYRLIASKVNSRTYTDKNVKSKNTYHYKVTSIDANGRESTAAMINATVP